MFLKSDPISTDLGSLILRLAFGGTLFWQHGLPKLLHFGERMEGFADPLGLGSPVSLALIVFAEVVCAVLAVLGLWTRLACLPVIAGMAVAAFMVKAAEPFAEKELALLYMLAFIVLFFAGSGRFSIDRITFR